SRTMKIQLVSAAPVRRGDEACPRLESCVVALDGQSSHWSACPEPRLGGFGAPEPVAGLSTMSAVAGAALSEDGLTLVYAGGEPQDLFWATRERRNGDFTGSGAIPGVSEAADEGAPHLDRGGFLYFSSDRTGGVGGYDLWFSARSMTGSFAAPRLVEGINGPGDERNPWLSPDGSMLVFDATRAGGLEKPDLWRARRPDATSPFGDAVPIAELNTDG